MAGVVETSAIQAVLVAREGTIARAQSGNTPGKVLLSSNGFGILNSKRLSEGGAGNLFLPIRRRSLAPRLVGRIQQWRACAAGGGEDTSFQNPQSSAGAYFADTPGYLNVKESNFFKPPVKENGWEDYRLRAQLRALSVIADDRSEMHAAVAIQRDNWGKLLQVTVITSMISAAILSALNSGPTQSFSLRLTAVLLAGVATVFMSLANWFQPSQLAEEQRSAARFFLSMEKEIQESLKPGGGSHLKENARVFYNRKLDRLQHLDRAYPLPLFPGGLDKFPKNPEPTILSSPVDGSRKEVSMSEGDDKNGWTTAIVEDLKRTSELLNASDILTYATWQKNTSKINKALAISGPVLGFLSIVANLYPRGGTLGAVLAAGCCVMAALISSFSHDAQVGMIYEMYRDVAGSFRDIDNEIKRNLSMPVEDRQNGELFHQRIALQLGRIEGQAIVGSSAQKYAGNLLLQLPLQPVEQN